MGKKVEYMNLFKCLNCGKHRNKEPLKLCDECTKGLAGENKEFLKPKKVKKPKKTRAEFTTSKVEKYLETKPEGVTIDQIVKDMKLPKEKVKNSINKMAERRNSTRVVSTSVTLYKLEKK